MRDVYVRDGRRGAAAQLVRLSRTAEVEFVFNEWRRARDGLPRGQDWQTWSAAMYLYAAHCLETRTTPFFTALRTPEHKPV